MHVYMFAPNNLITSAPEHAVYIGMVYCAQILFLLTSFFGKKFSQISYNVLENKWWRPYQFLAHYFFKLKLYNWRSVYFETYFKTSLSNMYVLFLFCQIGCTIFFNCPRLIHLLATCWHFFWVLNSPRPSRLCCFFSNWLRNFFKTVRDQHIYMLSPWYVLLLQKNLTVHDQYISLPRADIFLWVQLVFLNSPRPYHIYAVFFSNWLCNFLKLYATNMCTCYLTFC
jgi:hypothetical protein